MINLYIANSDFNNPFTNRRTLKRIYLFCGLLIKDDDEIKLNICLNEIKSRYSQNTNFPLKWDIESIEIWYKNRNLEKIYNDLATDAFSWKKKLFTKLLDLNFEFLISIMINRCSSKKELTNPDSAIVHYSFIKLLQRLGIHIKKQIEKQKSSESISVTVESLYKDLIHSKLSEEYKNAYEHGASYFKSPYNNISKYYSGPLERLYFTSELNFEELYYNDALQISGILIEVFREFIYFALHEPYRKLEVEMFRLVKDKMRGALNPDEIFKRGLSINSFGANLDTISKMEKKILQAFRKL